MRAAQSFGVDDIRFVADAPDPEPFETDAIVKTEMASLCGSDLHMVGKGWQMPEYPAPPDIPARRASASSKSHRRRYPDGEGIDILAPATGPDGSAHLWYAKVFCRVSGRRRCAHAEDAAGAPVEHVLMTQQLGTVIFATQRLPESLEGLTCAVLGQGSAGLFWDFVLKRRGASRVISIEPVDSRRSLSARYGADETVNVTGDAAKDAVYDLTDGNGADIVIEAVGSTRL